MKIYASLDDLPKKPIEPVATMGNFDGIHRGHQAILARLKQESQRKGVPTMVITFNPHPHQVFRPDEQFSPIMNIKERLRRLWHLGIDHALVLPFTPDLYEMSAHEFTEEILWERLRVTAMYVGPYVRYGQGREGDLRMLESHGRQFGFTVGVVDPVSIQKRRVSSTLIRKLIESGNLEGTVRLLGRHHTLVGEVIKGDGRGRTIGVPTANIAMDGTILPPAGVYAAWVRCEDESRWPAAVNLGRRPTFGDVGSAIEAHLIGYKGDLYGQEIFISLVEHIRPEIAFPDAQTLKIQIKRDIKETKRILGV